MAVNSRQSWLSIGALAFILALTAAKPTFADSPPPAPAAKPAALTIADPNIEIEDLKLLVEPLTKAQLDIESDAWFALLRNKATQISDAELAVRRKNREITSLKEVKAAAEKVADASKVEQKADAAPQSDEAKAAAAKLAEANAKLVQSVAESKKEDASVSPSAAPTAPTAAATPKGGSAAPATPVSADKAIMQRAVDAAQKTADKTGDQSEVAEKQAAANKEAAAAKDIAALASQTPAAANQAGAGSQAGAAAPAGAAAQATAKAESLVAKTDEAAAAKSEVKVELVDYSTKLGAERTEIIDRFKVVLDQLDVEGGDSKAQRAYISAVSGLKVEVSDYVATFARLKAWAMSDEGGLRWVRNLGLFLAYVIGAMLLARIVRAIIKRSIGHAAATSKLLRNFIVDMSGRAIVFCGVLAGLSALEVNLAPLLAVIGAAGFVVAFALQGTLSNFASGLLIMVNKPFDIGDRVTVGGDIEGRVENVSIFTTSIITEENTRKIVPNNNILAGVIVNHTTGEVAPAPEMAKA